MDPNNQQIEANSKPLESKLHWMAWPTNHNLLDTSVCWTLELNPVNLWSLFGSPHQRPRLRGLSRRRSRRMGEASMPRGAAPFDATILQPNGWCSYLCVHMCVHIYIYRYVCMCLYVYVHKNIFEPSAIFSEQKCIYRCCLRFWVSPSLYSVLAVSFSCSTTLILERPSPAAGWIFVPW